MSGSRQISSTALLAAIVAIVMVALGAALFLSSDEAGTQRVALLLALIGTVLPQLVGMLRGDAAANQLNGTLDQRIAANVLRANYVRRTSDVTPDEAAPRGNEAVTNPTTLLPPQPDDPEGLG